MPLTRKLQVLPLRVLVCEAKIAPVPLNKAVWKDSSSLGVESLAFTAKHGFPPYKSYLQGQALS